MIVVVQCEKKANFNPTLKNARKCPRIHMVTLCCRLPSFQFANSCFAVLLDIQEQIGTGCLLCCLVVEVSWHGKSMDALLPQFILESISEPQHCPSEQNEERLAANRNNASPLFPEH